MTIIQNVQIVTVMVVSLAVIQEESRETKNKFNLCYKEVMLKNY